MKTVKEVSQLTGVSIRTLHHYDFLGLLKPAQVSDAGYRLYDACSLQRLNMILLYKELGLSLKEIKSLLDAEECTHDQFLEHRICQMQSEIRKLQDRVSLARSLKTTGGEFMEFREFDAKKMDEYSEQAKMLYGKTDAYKEYSQKSKNRTQDQEKALGDQVMSFFAELGKLRHCEPDCDAAQNWVKDLQNFFTEHYYTCTPQILSSLAESYADGGSMNANIDKAGGDGTGAFAKQVINAYIKRL